MDKDIVFDTCMQIRYNYDGCKKGMRPSGGRCVPARGRVKQGNNTGMKGNNTGMKVAAGVLGAGALGTAIALPFALGGRKGKGAAETKTTKESGAKATGRATPLTGRELSMEEWKTAREKPRDPSINRSLLDEPGPYSRKEAEQKYPQWFKPNSGETSSDESPKPKKQRSSNRDVRQFKREQGVPDADRRIPKPGERRRPEDPRMMGRSSTSLAEASEEVDISPAKNLDPRKLGRGQGDRRIPTERRRPENPRMRGKKDSAQLCFDAISFVLSDRY